MSEKEVKERLNYFKTISILYGDTFAMSTELLKQLQKDIETALQLLEQKDKRIDELEKSLIDEQLKHREKIEELESELYNANCIIADYIEERNKLKNKMIGDKMEQFDDYIIYLIESYLKILEE